MGRDSIESYFNFMKLFRRTREEWSDVELAIEAARKWRELTQSQRQQYATCVLKRCGVRKISPARPRNNNWCPFDVVKDNQGGHTMMYKVKCPAPKKRKKRAEKKPPPPEEPNVAANQGMPEKKKCHGIIVMHEEDGDHGQPEDDDTDDYPDLDNDEEHDDSDSGRRIGSCTWHEHGCNPEDEMAGADLLDDDYIDYNGTNGSTASNGNSASNGHASNGFASNGHASNGFASNGHASNGFASNGHASNGFASNGFASNGHAVSNGHAHGMNGLYGTNGHSRAHSKSRGYYNTPSNSTIDTEISDLPYSPDRTRRSMNSSISQSLKRNRMARSHHKYLKNAQSVKSSRTGMHPLDDNFDDSEKTLTTHVPLGNCLKVCDESNLSSCQPQLPSTQSQPEDSKRHCDHTTERLAEDQRRSNAIKRHNEDLKRRCNQLTKRQSNHTIAVAKRHSSLTSTTESNRFTNEEKRRQNLARRRQNLAKRRNAETESNSECYPQSSESIDETSHSRSLNNRQRRPCNTCQKCTVFRKTLCPIM